MQLRRLNIEWYIRSKIRRNTVFQNVRFFRTKYKNHNSTCRRKQQAYTNSCSRNTNQQYYYYLRIPDCKIWKIVFALPNDVRQQYGYRGLFKDCIIAY